MIEPTSDARAGLSWLSNIALGIAASALIGMVIIEGWQVLARYVLNDSPSWTEPVALLLINTTMMFSASVGVRNGSHFGFNVLVARAPHTLQLLMRVIAGVITATIGCLLMWYGGVIALDTWAVKLAGTDLKQGSLYVPIAAGGTLIMIFAVEKLFAVIMDRHQRPQQQPQQQTAV